VMPGSHEMSPGAGMEISSVPGTVFGCHMLSFCLPLKEVCKCVFCM
jgi:hypothetical protein